jgi:hypothetical protein
LNNDEQHSVTSDNDPIRRSRREAFSFNVAWLKHGERLTLAQRIGFTILSLFFVLAGVYALTLIAADMVANGLVLLGNLWDLCLATIFALIFLIPGILGLRNVLRFPKDEHSWH